MDINSPVICATDVLISLPFSLCRTKFLWPLKRCQRQIEKYYGSAIKFNLIKKCKRIFFLCPLAVAFISLFNFLELFFRVIHIFPFYNWIWLMHLSCNVHSFFVVNWKKLVDFSLNHHHPHLHSYFFS